MTSSDEFREFGKAMIDYVADYLDNIRDRRVVPDVKPGYIRHVISCNKIILSRFFYKDDKKDLILFNWR